MVKPHEIKFNINHNHNIFSSMIMNNLLSIIAKQKFKASMLKFVEYSQTLEGLLSEKHASTYTREYLSEVKLLGTDGFDGKEDPSDDLIGLRDDFPSILRGSLLLYVIASFENNTKNFVNNQFKEIITPEKVKLKAEFDAKAKIKAKETLDKIAIVKGDNLKTISTKFNKILPGVIDADAMKRFSHYKHIRDLCAHNSGKLSLDLRDIKNVSLAAQELPGVIFQPYVEDRDSEDAKDSFSKELLASGSVEFTNTFIPESIKFFTEQFHNITSS